MRKSNGRIRKSIFEGGVLAGLIFFGVTIGFPILLGYGFFRSYESEFKREQKKNFWIHDQQSIRAQVLEERYMSSLENAEKKAEISGGGIGVGPGGIGFAGGGGTIRYEGLEAKNKYILTVRTNDGKILSLNILDGPTQTKEGLDAIVNQGSQISFPPGNIEFGEIMFGRHRRGYVEVSGETNITENTYIASKRADRIKVH